MEGIDIQVYRVGALRDIALFKAFGYIDTNTSPELQKEIGHIIEEGTSQFIVDMGGVQYVSSAGWGVFVGEIRGLREAGGDLKITQMSPDVYEVFEMLEFNRILAHYETIEEAVEDFDFYRDVHAVPNPVQSPKSQTAQPTQHRSENIVAPPEPLNVVADKSALSGPTIAADTKNQPATNLPKNGRHPQNETFTPPSLFKKRNNLQVDPADLPINEKVRRAVLDNPVIGVMGIRKALNSPKFGYTQINPFKLSKLLKKLSLDTKAKRYRYYRSR